MQDTGIMASIAAQLVSLKEQKPDASKYTEEAESIKWGVLVGDIKKQLDLITLLEDMKEQLISKLSAIFTYKGTVSNKSELPEEAEIGEVYNVDDTGANYCWNGSEWDKLSETIDLSGYALQDDITKEEKAREDADLALGEKFVAELQTEVEERTKTTEEIISKIWNGKDLTKGYFQTKFTHNDGSEAMIWNESDGGGNSYWNKETGYRGYTGVNDGSAKDIYVQLYCVEYGKSNKGPRIQLTKDRACYSKDSTQVGEEYEIVIKSDINNFVTEDKVKELIAEALKENE